VGFCPTPGCRSRSSGPCRSCRATTQRALDLGRGSPAERGYDKAWAATAKAFLERHPVCEKCGAPATVPDHQPTRRELVTMGAEDPDADRWLHPLCASCHGRKTALEDHRWG
jgi:5-methylcytosine-specific restriction enzyme A